MNSPRPNKAPYEPNVALRLLIWFGIYFAAQLPLFPYREDFRWFPFGLTFPFFALLDKITGKELSAPGWVVDATYVFYLLHLAASVIVRRKKTFRILIWILIIVVLFNLAGCELGRHMG